VTLSLRDFNRFPDCLFIYWNYFILPSIGYCMFVSLLFGRNRTMRKAILRKLKLKFGKMSKPEFELELQEHNNNNLP
jgi:hypothetical protein